VDVERTIEFILDTQAKFFAGMEEMRAGIAEMRAGMEEMRQETRQQFAAQGQINAALGKAMLGLTEHIERLTTAQTTTDERLNRLAEIQATAQAATDERLNALIGVVDGLVRRPSM
jgi:hypothetical protein